MPIAMLYRHGRNCPTFVCDVCQQPIVEHGNILWDPDEPDMLYFVHKGACNDTMEAIHAPVHLYLEEMSWFMVFLANNTKISPRALVKKEALIKQFNVF